jgi:hypothetical protein
MNAGVALLTTATVTTLNASGASIASANIGNLQFTAASIASINAGVAVINNLTATSASIASANVGVALITTGTVTALTATGASVASANVGTAVITGLTVTGASIASVNAGTATLSGNLTLNGGTANGVLFLNGSKVATSGSALTFDGTNGLGFGTGGTGNTAAVLTLKGSSATNYGAAITGTRNGSGSWFIGDAGTALGSGTLGFIYYNYTTNDPWIWYDGGASAERMRLTSTGLGIGTSSPTSGFKLDVIGDARFSDVAGDDGVEIGWSAGGSKGFVQAYDRNASAFRTLILNNALDIDPSGNLGLGVTPSAWNLGKAIEVGAVGNSIWGNGAGNIRVLSNAYYNGAFKYATSAAASQYTQDGGTHAWSIAPSWNGTGSDVISFTQAMTLDASGNLLVGTTSSTLGRLEVVGGAGIRVNEDAAGTKVISIRSAFAGGDPAINVSTNHPLTFLTNNTERARITSGGYFKASDAGTYVGSTGTYHELRNTANETAALFSCSNTGFTSSVMSSTAYPVAGTGFNHLICRSNNGNDEVMKIRGDGNLYNTNGTYGTISDQRLKQDIADAPSQWNDIKAVRFRKYRMKDDVARDENAPYLLGVVAQELEQVSPGLVDDGEVKTVKSSILLMKAAVALQEAMTRIEQLEAKVAALESK